MYFINLIHATLISLGLLDKRAKLLLLGLDNSGKSTLLYRLITDELGALDPTGRPTSEELKIDNALCTTFDLGDHQQARSLWEDHLREVGGIVFVVDAADPERFDEARAELWALFAKKELADVAFLVLGNKIDDENAVSDVELRARLGLNNPLREDVRLFMCSVVERQGYGEVLRWLADRL
ncbi:ARF/SAR superfamily [Daldinia caldariorum]|uniref:ARF/SAR superfamily n=1 Tax=Daldinia caldariorum TaxID=326644 RepID=UPI0020084A0B|nr:ARF/SAR superfamily [Daldinia caldariorum]KAI1468095.1 ARF/SAR superfamily [Daldinia caldariorum]